MDIVVDSNVILDIVTEDKRWFSWSSEVLSRHAETHSLVINPIIYAEVSMGFDRIEDLEAALSPGLFRRDPIHGKLLSSLGSAFFSTEKREEVSDRRFPIFSLEHMPLYLEFPC